MPSEKFYSTCRVGRGGGGLEKEAIFSTFVKRNKHGGTYSKVMPTYVILAVLDAVRTTHADEW